VIVLHSGRILASGPVPEVVAAAGTRTLKPAFDQLVRGVPT
jgi:hypothetical protein